MNCIGNEFTFDVRLQLVNDHNGLKVISQIVHLCADKSQLEWGLVCEPIK